MTGLRIAFLFVAVVTGDYAAFTLIDGQLSDFGVAAIICAASSIAAGLIAYSDDEATRRLYELGRQRRKVVARALGDRHVHQAATAHDLQISKYETAHQTPSESPRFAHSQPAWAHSRRSPIQSRRDRPGMEVST